MSMIRWILGRFILLYEFFFTPKSQVVRTPEQQSMVDLRTSKMAIYQYRTCPFCLKVRLGMASLGIKIDLRDAKNDLKIKAELIEKGGMDQVPCLRIQKDNGTLQWMYESSDILTFLNAQFGNKPN
jgi:glutaredoxin